jgi:hypothetical protein
MVSRRGRANSWIGVGLAMATLGNAYALLTIYPYVGRSETPGEIPVTRIKKSMTKTATLTCVLLSAIGTAQANDWTGLVTIGAVQPSVVDEGGVVRVGLTSPLTVPYCGNSSGQASNLDFLFTNGTQEGRSALVAALYLALVESKQVTFLLSSAGCSPYGSPVVVGMNVGS